MGFTFSKLSHHDGIRPQRRLFETQVVPALKEFRDLRSLDSAYVVPFTPDDLGGLADAPLGRSLADLSVYLDPSPEVLAALARFPKLIRCSFRGNMDDDELVSFSRALPRKIVHLNLLLERDSRIVERGIAALTSLPLATLHFTGPGFDRAFAKAVAAMPHLDFFGEHCYGTDIQMPLDDDMAADFAASKSLQILYLQQNGFTDAALDSFAKMPALVQLNLTHNSGRDGMKITEAGVKKLAAARPALRIEWDGGVIHGVPTSTSGRSSGTPATKSPGM